MKICLVCSSGGHLYELYRLRGAYKEHDIFWVTFPGRDTRVILRDERVIHGRSPTNRSFKNFIRNFLLASRILKREKPDAIISTGAGICVPFFLMGRLKGIRTIYVESMARIESLSLTGRLVYNLADDFLVQWPELASKARRAVYQGDML